MPKEGDVVVNEHGAKQAHVSARMDLIPPENLLLLGECLAYGAERYGEGNWKGITIQDNLNHALIHILKWLSGDRSEPHLVNAIARTNFALWHAIQTQEQPTFYNHPNLASKDQDEDGDKKEETSDPHSFIPVKDPRFSDQSYVPAGSRATSTRYRNDGVKP